MKIKEGGVMDIQDDKDFAALPEVARLYQACKERDLTIAEREYLKGARDAWQAKAQAVPEWISTSERMPNEGEEVFVHYYGQISQATRDKKYSGGFKQRNCYGWESVSSYISHWMPKSIELPEPYHFYYENDAKQKALTEAQEPAND